jgi:hypothetical protein
VPRTDSSAPLTLPSPPGRRVERVKLLRGDGTSLASFLVCDLFADGALERRLQLRQDLLVARADGGGRGGGRAPAPRGSASGRAGSSAIRASEEADLLTSCLITASRLLILRRRPLRR